MIVLRNTLLSIILSITLHAQYFKLQLTPTVQNVSQNDTVKFLLNITPLNSFNATVFISVENPFNKNLDPQLYTIDPPYNNQVIKFHTGMRDTISYSFSVIGYNGNFKDSVFGNFKINKRESNIFKYVDLKKVKYDNLTSDTKNLPHYVATFCNDNLKNLYIQLDATFGYIKFDTTWNIYKTDYNKDGGSTYWHMQVDSKNTAWVQNFNSSGLMKHDGKFWSYIDAQTFSKDAGLGRGTINFFDVDSIGNVWRRGDNGSLAKFDGSNWSLFRPTGVDSRKSEWQQDFDKRLLIDKKGNIYQVFNKHILIFKTDSTWEDHPLDTDLKSAPYGQAGAIDLNGNIWFLTLKNNNVVFIRYNNNNWDIISTPIVSDTLGYQKLIFTLDSTMYLITTTGIHYNESSIWHTYNPNNSEVLSFSTTAAVDKKGNLWMRYSANYVAVFNPKGITELPQLTTVYDPEVYFDDNRVQILKVNSTQECLVVTVSDDTSKELDIYNLYGEQVLKTPIDGINNTNIDITHLMSGVYVGRIGDKSQLFILSK